MIDLKWIREFPEEFDKSLKRRGMAPHSAKILDLDHRHRSCLNELQSLQERRNEVAKEMGILKRQGQEAHHLVEEGTRIKEKIDHLEKESVLLKAQIEGVLVMIPNVLDRSVPVGKDETFNQEVRRVGEPKAFDFAPLQHFELGENLGLMDFERAAFLSGSRFVVLKGALARLERALSEFMLDIHTTEFGYEEVALPLLVRDQVLYGTGHLPKFEEDLFKTTDNRWLIPTGEVTLTSLGAESIFDEEGLPLRYVASTPCFRSEAGAAGRDTRGMLRQHQFHKVELVSLTRPDQSDEEHERMVSAAETVLKRLELPYRVMLLCEGDTGFQSRKTYDLEVWLPGQQHYREISSCSNCGDFQARRMNGKYRPAGQGKKEKPTLLHTLNGSGLAVGRTLIAILENYQQADGSIEVPQALKPYMNGLEEIRGHARR
jgi:seryl-tRNA synthetase